MNSPDQDEAMPITEHLLELRSRLLRSVLAVLVVFLALFSFSNEIYTLIATPLMQNLPEGSQMIATDVAAPFLTPFKLSMVVSVFLAAPYILFEVWGFIAPALFQHEKRLLLPVLLASVILFYCGIAFAYFVVFPLMFAFFSAAGPQGIAYTPDISRFLDTVLKLFFAFGVAFEVPIATVILVRTGATSVASLSEKRPYVIVGCFVIGMLLTPPDPLSQCLMAVPMWLLFESGLLFSRLLPTPPAKADEAE